MSELLAGRSVLVVAKKLDDIGQIRSIIVGLGAQGVDVASSANMAISMLRSHPYDLLIADDDLGEGEKNGLQIIEESSRENIRRCVDTYALIVDKDVARLPRDSILCGADTFIAKPIDSNKIKQRLEKLMKLKQAVFSVETLIDQQSYDEALIEIPKVVSRYPSLELYLERLKGRVLLAQENYSSASEHFGEIIQEREIDWAYLGKGISEYHLGRYSNAVKALQEVLQQNDKSLEAYEWLSLVLRAMGQNIEVQSLLTTACRQLPTFPSVHAGLGNIASENNNWDAASDAFRTAVEYAKHSYHQTQDNYFGLARSLQTKLTDDGDDRTAAVLEEAVRVLESVVEEYYDDEMTRFRSRLMTAESYQNTGDIQRANSAAKDAFSAYQVLDDSLQAQEMDNLLEGIVGTDVHQEAEAYKSEFNKKVFAGTEWGKLNQQGMSFYRKGQFAEAFTCFEKSIEMVGNPSILLNLVQAGHELIKQDPLKGQEVLTLCNRYWLKMNIGALSKKQQDRYRNLSNKRAQLLENMDC